MKLRNTDVWILLCCNTPTLNATISDSHSWTTRSTCVSSQCYQQIRQQHHTTHKQFTNVKLALVQRYTITPHRRWNNSPQACQAPSYWHRSRSMRQGLCNGTVSVRQSVRLIHRPLHADAAGLLLWARWCAGDIDRYRRPLSPCAAARLSAAADASSGTLSADVGCWTQTRFVSVRDMHICQVNRVIVLSRNITGTMIYILLLHQPHLTAWRGLFSTPKL